MGTLKTMDVVIEGQGTVTVGLYNKETGNSLATLTQTLTEDITVLSHSNIQLPIANLSIIELRAFVSQHDKPVKSLAVVIA